MRYLKDHKVTLWESVSQQDNMGAMHTTYREVGTFWAHYRPVSIASKYGVAALHEIADVVFTINKPSWFDDETVVTDMFCVWHHRVYKVVRVEDVDGMTRGDVKLYMQQERNMDEETFERKKL